MKSLDTLVENLKSVILNEKGFNALEYENNRIEKLEKRIANIKNLINLKQKNPADYKEKEDEIRKHTPNIDKNIFGATVENLQRKIQQLEDQKDKSDLGSENDTFDPKEQAERNKMFGIDDHTQKMRAITKAKGKVWKFIVEYATVTGGPNLNDSDGISELLKKAEDAGKPITVKQAKEIIVNRSKKQQEVCEKYFNLLSKQVDALINIEEGKVNEKDYIVQSANKKYFNSNQAVGKELKNLLPQIAPDKLNWDKKAIPSEKLKNRDNEEISVQLATKSGLPAGERYNAFVYEKLRPYISSLREFAEKSGIAQTKNVVADLLSKNKTFRKSREEKLDKILNTEKDEDFEKDFNNFRKTERELDRSENAKIEAKDKEGKFDNKAYQGERLGTQHTERAMLGGNKSFNNIAGLKILGRIEFRKMIDKWIEEGQKPDDKHKVYWMSMPSAKGTATATTGAGKLALIYDPEIKSDFNIDGWYGFKVHKNAFITSGTDYTTKESYILPKSELEYIKAGVSKENLSNILEKTKAIKNYEQYIEKVPKELKTKVKELVQKKFENVKLSSVRENIDKAVKTLVESFFNY